MNDLNHSRNLAVRLRAGCFLGVFLLPVLMAGLIPTGRVTAQTFTGLHNFTYTNADGGSPYAGLILSGTTLYGTALLGSGGDGTVFAVNTDGTGFTNLHTFTTIVAPYVTNSDGAQPYAGLILSGNTLYGTASAGGSSDYGYGTVFAVNTDSTGFTNLHSFTLADGAAPLGPDVKPGPRG